MNHDFSHLPITSADERVSPETLHPDCAQVVPFLTELFDGEADAESARRARAHLLACQECARTWLQWNQGRTLLRSTRVPAPPPTLLWRILLACRMENKRISLLGRIQNSFQAGWNRVVGQRPTAENTAPAAPLLRALEPECAPSELAARILMQTTRATMPATVATPTRAPSSVAWPRFLWPKMGMSALAAPALAAFLLVLQRDSLVPTVANLPDNAPVTVPVSAPVESERISRNTEPQRAVSASAARPQNVPNANSRRSTSQPTEMVAPSRPIVVPAPTTSRTAEVQPEAPRARRVVIARPTNSPSRPVSQERTATVQREAPRRESRATTAPKTAPRSVFAGLVVAQPVAPRFVATSASGTRQSANSPAAPRSAAPNSSVVSRKSESRVAPNSQPAVRVVATPKVARVASVRVAPVRLASLSLDRATPRGAGATRPSAPLRRVAAPAAPLRASRPTLAAAPERLVARAPEPVVPDDTLDEMRDVVSGFRAALAEDEADWETS